MTLRLYNTLTRSIQQFEPLDPAVVKMYVCGPTVYDDPHLGHARSAYIFDVLRRYLDDKGFGVQFVRNVTDVDDKIIEKVRQELGGEPAPASGLRGGPGGRGARDLQAKCQEVAQRYLKSYHETLERLGVGRPTEEPLATRHVVPEMTDLISKLLLQGVAYEAGGDVYFAVRKFPGYGKLSNRTLDELQAGARVEPGEHKQDPLDFALWKSAKPEEPSWDSPWGKGRPGWHIECTAMSTTYLGDAFDIHGGGVDLIFPHHENEIAQAQAADKPFARYWIHNGLLTVNGEKMSKSLGNFVTVDQALQECNDEADIVKVFFLGTHYRGPIDYTTENLKAAAARYQRWRYLFHFADVSGEPVALQSLPGDIPKLQQEFEQAMDEDFNTPGALAILDRIATLGYQLLSHVESRSLAWGDPRVRLQRERMVHVVKALQQLGGMFGLFGTYQHVIIPPEVERLVQVREEARKQQDFQTADKIRKQVEGMGFIIADSAGGAVILPKQ